MVNMLNSLSWHFYLVFCYNEDFEVLVKVIVERLHSDNNLFFIMTRKLHNEKLIIRFSQNCTSEVTFVSLAHTVG